MEFSCAIFSIVNQMLISIFPKKNKVNKYKTTAADIDEIIITGAIVICWINTVWVAVWSIKWKMRMQLMWECRTFRWIDLQRFDEFIDLWHFIECFYHKFEMRQIGSVALRHRINILCLDILSSWIAIIFTLVAKHSGLNSSYLEMFCWCARAVCTLELACTQSSDSAFIPTSVSVYFSATRFDMNCKPIYENHPINRS